MAVTFLDRLVQGALARVVPGQGQGFSYLRGGISGVA